MANAKKCDVCGKFYKPYNEKQNDKKVNGFMFLNINTQMKYWSHNAYDCCPDCMDRIKNFIDTLKPGIEKGDEE